MPPLVFPGRRAGQPMAVRGLAWAVRLLGFLVLHAAVSLSSSSSTDTMYAQNPTVFAPGGRLVAVEECLQAVEADAPLHNLVVAIQCATGIVVVTTDVQSPYFLATTQQSQPSHNPSSSSSSSSSFADNLHDTSPLVLASPHSAFLPPPPFARLGPSVWGVTGGSVTDGQLLRLCLHRVTEEQLAGGNDDDQSRQAVVIARALADARQMATQRPGDTNHNDDSESSGVRLWNATALLWDQPRSGPDDNKGGCIWRVDPTGQFFSCQVAVVGRKATAVEAALEELVLESLRRDQPPTVDGPASTSMGSTSTATTTTATIHSAASVPMVHPRQLQAHVASLSASEALSLAVAAIRSSFPPKPPTNKDGGELVPPLRLRALQLLQDQSRPTWIAHEDLR